MMQAGLNDVVDFMLQQSSSSTMIIHQIVTILQLTKT